MDDVIALCDKIKGQFEKYDQQRLFTVAVSGIDASGKGYVTKMMQQELETRNYNVATINIDPWHNPISARLKKENAAENFYLNSFRWKEFFNDLIVPLQREKSIELETTKIDIILISIPTVPWIFC
jgi:uridine kinase